MHAPQRPPPDRVVEIAVIRALKGAKDRVYGRASRGNKRDSKETSETAQKIARKDV